jgi:hypothetical protein
MGNFGDKVDDLIHLLEDELLNAEQVAVKTMLAAYLGRIFNRGASSDETKIGEYSTKPMLTGAKNFRTKGKAEAFFDKEDIEFRTVNTKRGKKALAIVKGGYREFRQLNGNQAEFVDLQFTGSLFESIKDGLHDGHFVIGFDNIEKAQIAHHLEKKYNKIIFKPSAEEIAIAEEAYKDYLKEKIQQLFNTW